MNSISLKVILKLTSIVMVYHEIFLKPGSQYIKHYSIQHNADYKPIHMNIGIVTRSFRECQQRKLLNNG